jgi:copper(I)-binding protein
MRTAGFVSLVSAALAVLLPFCPSVAAEIDVTDARVPVTERIGADIPLVMRVTNHAATPDALLRVRCPFANFSERQTVDYGEGAPARRAVSSIPVPANGEVALTTRSFHIMLLQTREALTDGQVLTCSAAFRNAGTQDIEVRVSAQP